MSLITFGEGTATYSTATPTSLGFSTSYTPTTTPRLSDGSFSILNAMQTDYSGAWFSGGLDHTQSCSATGAKGYMVLVGIKSAHDNIISVNIKNLCIGLRYQFSVYIANV